MLAGHIRVEASRVGRVTRESLGCQAKELVFALKARKSFEAGGLGGEKVRPGYNAGPAPGPTRARSRCSACLLKNG